MNEGFNQFRQTETVLALTAATRLPWAECHRILLAVNYDLDAAIELTVRRGYW
jgi:hypothetical protein